MPIVNGYITLAEVKDRLGIETSTQDESLEKAIEAVSRKIDKVCWRRFYNTTETRYYTADDVNSIYVDDITAVTTLKTDEDGDRVYEITWQTTDYDLMPFNASLDGRPYTEIAITPAGDYSFPKGVAKGVELAGNFGYVATGEDPPDDVIEAAFLGVNRLYARRETPLGVGASSAFGQITVQVRQLSSDPDFIDMLSGFIRGA